MLKWTCRLRDLFEKEGYRTYERSLKHTSKIQEAEFVDGNFPEEFRWEIFKNCCKPYTYDNVLMFNRDSVVRDKSLVPVFDSYSSESQHIRPTCGLPITCLLQRKIDIFWISPTVFISGVGFFLESVRLQDFEVWFNVTDCFSCRIYTLSAFGEGEREPCSSLAMRFFRHLIAPLPANYFSKITLRVGCQAAVKRFQLDDFLSIIPHDAPQPPPCNADIPSTSFELFLRDRDIIKQNDGINQNELRAIFSHKFHPVVKMSFHGCRFDPSISFDVFCDLLRQARFLRAVGLPIHLMRAKEEPQLICKRIILKSQDLTASFSGWNYFPGISHELLHTFAARHQVTDIRMEFPEDFLERETNREELHACIKPFFQWNSNLEQLTIQFDGPRDLDHGRLEHVVAACLSRNLCVFNVSFNFCTIDRSLNRVQSWDHRVFPRLSVNYWRIKLKKPDTPMALAVRAVNQGLIYRKTTDHVPYNGTIAYAGDIFCVVKHGARRFGRHGRRAD
jgi:hypothetical protein